MYCRIHSDQNTTCQYALETYQLCGNATGYTASIASVSHYLLIPFLFFNLALRTYIAAVIFRIKRKNSIYEEIYNQLSQFENWVDVGSNFLVIYLFFASGNLTSEDIHLQNVASSAVLLMSLNMMFKLAKFPWLGVYVSMFFSVAKEYLVMSTIFAGIFTSYMLAFDISFMGYFQKGGFSNAKLVGVMIGELDLNDMISSINSSKLPNQSSQIFSELLLSSFIGVVAVVCANLLIGIVVSDIAVLKAEAFKESLSKRIEIAESIELIFPRLFRKLHPYWISHKEDYSEDFIIRKYLTRENLYFSCFQGTGVTYSLSILKDAVKIGMKRQPAKAKISANPLSKLNNCLDELKIKLHDKLVRSQLMRTLHEVLADCLKINDDDD